MTSKRQTSIRGRGIRFVFAGRIAIIVDAAGWQQVALETRSHRQFFGGGDITRIVREVYAAVTDKIPHGGHFRGVEREGSCRAVVPPEGSAGRVLVRREAACRPS